MADSTATTGIQTGTPEWSESTISTKASDHSWIATSAESVASSAWQETTNAATTAAAAAPPEAAPTAMSSSAWPVETTLRPSTRAEEPQPQPPQGPGPAAAAALDQNAIIAGVVFGVLLIGIILAGACLARTRRRRAAAAAAAGGAGDNVGGHKRRAKVPRPAPAGTSAHGGQPNPYSNPCFDATKEEMGERGHQAEEPTKDAQDSANSIRNKEDHWIIPLAELPNDDTSSNFDTTRF